MLYNHKLFGMMTQERLQHSKYVVNYKDIVNSGIDLDVLKKYKTPVVDKL